ncbi:CubicO group peptidase (beta-lactamase class C family) [Natronobacillus azotifigens]|uniref:Serine hydrolase n=1 Tax=Natronobacillus azotifigens TaxID=472978 RepID=A0A9J6RGE5_9BACI|nr:serine hydrolase domain-containing protein [Natronobacillus azotifigens]MCZ0704225.1 serine hydrolase [Natronobacillus azotifigens]
MIREAQLEAIEKVQQDIDFSGTCYVKTRAGIWTNSYGFANRAEKIKNKRNTRYGIASGSKFFTSIAICQLVEQGKLSFDTKLIDCLDVEFPNFDDQITVHHLLTHTSGIADYFDEDEMDDYEEIWVDQPMYHMRRLHNFLPLFQQKKRKAQAGVSFHYNNAGYIVLGLIVEKVSGLMFSNYVERNIFAKTGMEDSGYFEMDALPERTALGYIETADGGYRTNIFSVPVRGGSDGGVYITVDDMANLFDAMHDQLVRKETLLKPQVKVEDDIYYGYGGYMQISESGKVMKHILMGYDPGVNFRAVHYPDQLITIVVCSNQSAGAYEMIQEIEDNMIK